MMNTIVTVNGGTVEWYQGGEGYTDTVVSDLIHDWLDHSQITKVQKESVSFVELTNQNDFDWIHLDVEGIDGDLILSLEKLPNVKKNKEWSWQDYPDISQAPVFKNNIT